MKIKKIILFIIIFLSIILIKDKCFAVSIPQVVHDKALEVNYNIDNYLIFQDSSGNFHIPYQNSSNNSFSGNYWRLSPNRAGIFGPCNLTMSSVCYNVTNQSFSVNNYLLMSGTYGVMIDISKAELVYSSKPVLYSGSDEIYFENSFITPYIANTAENLSTCDDYILIFPRRLY